jgi:tRNA threonylcarbamoyladenosine biosynthesis protein TsaE
MGEVGERQIGDDGKRSKVHIAASGFAVETRWQSLLMTKLILNNQTETRAWVKDMTAKLRRPCLVRLEGELGAGKTQVVRWFLEELGAHDVASPTFAIHHEYSTQSGLVDHVDLYRVKNDEDLETSGFWDLFSQPMGLVFVEWSDRLPSEVWPPNWLHLKIQLNKIEGRIDARELNFKFVHGDEI